LRNEDVIEVSIILILQVKYKVCKSNHWYIFDDVTVRYCMLY